MKRTDMEDIHDESGMEQVSEKLKPCPFCGGEDIDPSFARGFLGGDKSRPIIMAGCYDCSATGPDIEVPENETGYKEAIEAWNTRHE